MSLIQTDEYKDDNRYVHIHIGGNSPESTEADSYFSISAPSAIENEEGIQKPLIHIGQNEYFLQTANYGK
jgi:hypothetical protein